MNANSKNKSYERNGPSGISNNPGSKNSYRWFYIFFPLNYQYHRILYFKEMKESNREELVDSIVKKI